MSRTKEAEMVLGNLVYAVEMLENCQEFSLLVPEVRVNLAYALPGAKTPDDVAAVDGRITVVRGYPHASGIPRFGASDHLARRLIETRKYDPTINAALNFKCDAISIEVVEEYCSEQGIPCGRVNRTKEPTEVAEKDGASMSWKIKQLVTSYGGIPRLFYEGEGWGKEPLFLALGNDAIEVAGIAIEIARRYRRRIAG